MCSRSPWRALARRIEITPINPLALFQVVAHIHGTPPAPLPEGGGAARPDEVGRQVVEESEMSHPCIVVLTARSPERIIEEGGSQAWRINPENARRFRYCVCVQNRRGGNWGGASEPDRRAFLIGQISGIERSLETSDRFIILFSRYARIEAENAWPGNRNPVRYGTLDEFKILEPSKLDWHDMPATGHQRHAQEEADPIHPLSIAEAKSGLAAWLKIPEEDIEIIIHA